LANVIQLKRVTSGTSAPGTSDLAEGELAINTNTGKLYFKDASDSIKFFADSTQSTAITFGIANTNAVKIDHASVADNDYAKFTANGVEGRSFAEVKTDLSLNNVENTAISSFAGTSNITTTGALNSGSITSGFGNIDNGSSTLDTGALTSTASTIENSGSALLKVSTTSGDGDSVASITFKNDNNTDGSDNNEVAHIGVRDNEDTLRFMVLSNGSPTYANFGSYSRFMIYANGNVQGTTSSGAKFFFCDAGGEYIYGTGVSLINIAGSSLYLHAQSENVIWDGSQYYPNTDDAKNLGHGSYRWNDIYATNSTIQTSDLNLKESVADTDLGLAFINKLKPKSYKWKTTPEQKYETAEESLTPDPEPTGPDKETGDVKQSAITHKRKHYGLIAQDVKSTLDELGISTDDFAGYIKPETGSLGLRYQEFIAPIIKAVQELSTKVEALENA
tara:strand:+ start:13221 stop:14564 length:1344 start_codon:yes stop_codon:yes gene_type:complete